LGSSINPHGAPKVPRNGICQMESKPACKPEKRLDRSHTRALSSAAGGRERRADHFFLPAGADFCEPLSGCLAAAFSGTFFFASSSRRALASLASTLLGYFWSISSKNTLASL